MILGVSVNDPLTDLSKFLRNGLIGLRQRYGCERRIILKLKVCTFTRHTLGTSIINFSFFGQRPFTLSPKFFPKWITRCKNRYGDEIRILLKLRTCTFTWTTLGTQINDFSFFGGRPSPDLPKFLRNG